MLTKRTGFMALVFGGAVVCGLWLLRTADAPLPTTAQPETTKSSQSRLDGELRALRAELSELKRQSQHTPTSVASAPEPPHMDSTPEGVAEPEPVPEAHRFVLRQGLAENLAAQVRDAAWAPQYETTINDTFRPLAHNRLREVSCASTLCQLRVEQQGAESEFELSRTIRDSFAGEVYGYPSDDGEVILFVAREGHPLPQPDAA